MKFQKTSGPVAGTVIERGASKIISGGPSCQSSGKVGGVGVLAAVPSSAPTLAHSPIKAICAWVSRNSPANDPYPCSGSHGGMYRRRVTSAILAACPFASSYVKSENGAGPPGWWHEAQFW